MDKEILAALDELREAFALNWQKMLMLCVGVFFGQALYGLGVHKIMFFAGMAIGALIIQVLAESIPALYAAYIWLLHKLTNKGD